MTHTPDKGALVIDVARMRMGRVMGTVGPYLQLRPPEGGCEWDADPARVRPVESGDLYSTRAHDEDSA